MHVSVLYTFMWLFTLSVFNAAFFFLSSDPSQRQQQAETQRDKETLCDTRHPTDSRPHKNLRGWESTSVTIATPSGNLRLNPQWIWLLIVSRGVGVEVHVRALAWVRDDHRSVVIYLCWLVALSSSVWVAHCSIIHQTDDWLWQDAEPGGVCVLSVCVVRERETDYKKCEEEWFLAYVWKKRVHDCGSAHFIT